jgi:hypothetical protein
MRWQPGQPVVVTLIRSVVVVVMPSRSGRYKITSQGHLRLPAAIRHRVQLATGSRLLIAACPDRNALVAYPVAVLDAVLFADPSTAQATE